MPWPLNTDPEQQVQLAVKQLLSDAGVRCILGTERKTPRTQAIVVSAEEQRTAVPHLDPETGKLCDWQQFQVTVDVVGDEKTPQGQMSQAAGAIFRAFKGANFLARNAVGLSTATVQKDKNAASGEDLKNPFVITCDTFTFIE